MSGQGQFNSVLGQFTQWSRRLYSLPAVATEVLKLTDEPKTDLVALQRCLERDPALTAKVLRVVNSSLFGLSRRVNDLRQALALLGARPLKMLVLGFSLPKELFAGLEAELLAWYWRRTLIKATAARELAQRFWQQPGDDAFLAGLLQDLGMLLLIQRLGDSYTRFLREVTQDGGDLLAMETLTLGFDHTILTARLLDQWELPRPIVEAVALPPDSERIAQLSADKQPLSQILHLSELIARLLADSQSHALEPLLAVGESYRQITVEALRQLVDDLQTRVNELSELFSLPAGPRENFVDLLLNAHQRLATLVESAVAATPPAAAAIRPAEPEPETARPRPSSQSANTPGLAVRVGSATADCRHHRQPLTLLLGEIDGYENLLVERGLDHAMHLIDLMEAAVDSLAEFDQQFVRVSDSRFALVLEALERPRAVELSRQLLRDVDDWSRRRGDRHPIQLSIGLATVTVPPKNFDSQNLIAAAERCLATAQTAGGNTVKSIDVL